MLPDTAQVLVLFISIIVKFLFPPYFKLSLKPTVNETPGMALPALAPCLWPVLPHQGHFSRVG